MLYTHMHSLHYLIQVSSVTDAILAKMRLQDYIALSLINF